MNILFIKHFLYDLWFMKYRECSYSGTVRIRLLFPKLVENNKINLYELKIH